MVSDAVCGMELEESKAAGKSEYKGKTYYFCSPSCKASFDKEPDRYAAKTEAGSGHEMHH